MKLYGLDETTAHTVVDRVSREFYEGNVRVHDSRDDSNSAGARVTIRLGVHDGRAGMSGAKGTASWSRQGTGPHGQPRTTAACWHAHRDVMRGWFAAGAERIVAGIAWRIVYTREDFEEQFPATARVNVGAPAFPATMPELCECYEPDHGPFGRLAAVRALFTPTHA